MKNKLFIFSGIVIAVSLLCVLFYTHSINKSHSDVDLIVSFDVEPGDTSKVIAAKLHDEDLISSEFLFYLYVRLSERGSDIIAGTSNLSPSMSIVEIVDELVTDTPVEQTILTIQEGLTVDQINEKLVSVGAVLGDEFLSAVVNFDDYDSYSFLNKSEIVDLKYPLEGYLYPDTYYINAESFNSEAFIKVMLDNFEKRVVDSGVMADCFPDYTTHECVIMASIIEREVFGEKDRAIVSGLFWKRLENAWTLGADATLLYVTDDNVITSKELLLDSPYNTRRNPGLPSGPICNPSVSSIRAAFNPVDSKFWFYLTTLDTGEVIYSKTNEEHNLNRIKYL